MPDFAGTHSNSPYISVFPFVVDTGMSPKYANPGTAWSGPGVGVDFSRDGGIVAGALFTSPYINAYVWNMASGYGTKYSNPGTLPGDVRRSLCFNGDYDQTIPTTDVVVGGQSGGSYVDAYPWTDGSGFGTRYSNPGTLPTGTVYSIKFLDNTDIACASSSSPYMLAWPFTPGSGWGTKYSNPATLPGGYGMGVDFSPLGSDIVVGDHANPVPAIYGYPFSSGSGFGSRYSNPSWPLDSYWHGRGCKFARTGLDVAVTGGPAIGTGNSNEILCWNFIPGSGFSTNRKPANYSCYPYVTYDCDWYEDINILGNDMSSSTWRHRGYIYDHTAGFGASLAIESVPGYGYEVAMGPDYPPIPPTSGGEVPFGAAARLLM